MNEPNRDTVAANVMAYVKAWNEPDAAARASLLARCWADDATYVDPTVELRGRDALVAHIGKVQASRPGAYLEMMSAVDLHHNVVRFLWRQVRADGSTGPVSIDFGEVDAAGRLTKIAGFFGEAPAK